MFFQFGQLLFMGFPAGQMRVPSPLKVNSAAVKYYRAFEDCFRSAVFALCFC